MDLKKRRALMKTFITSQFNCCPLTEPGCFTPGPLTIEKTRYMSEH